MGSLRGKLAIGFGGLLAMLGLLGFYSMYTLGRLGPAIDTIMRENYQSVVGCQRMQEALHRLDRGLQVMLLGHHEEGRLLVEESQREFREGLAQEYKAIYVPGEGAQADIISTLFSNLSSRVDCFRTGLCPPDTLVQAYNAELRPLSHQIHTTAGFILQMNEANMVAANQRARGMAVEAKTRMALLLGVGTFLALVAVQITSRSILKPIRRVTDSAQAIAAGDLDLRVAYSSRDELGRLATAFNDMATHLRAFRQSERDRLRRVETATQLVIDSLPDAVTLLRRDGRVEMANLTARQIFGFVTEEAAASPQRPWLEQVLAEAEREQIPAPDYSKAIQVFDRGRERFFLPTAYPIRDDQGSIVGTTLVLGDITALRQMDELKSDLLATLSHEVNSPLTGLRMAIYLLANERETGLTARQKDILASAREEADRLHQITGNLLNLARLESGRVNLDLRHIPARDVVEAGLQPYRKLFDEKGVVLAVDVDEDLPSVLADPARLNLVMSNLLSNALRYTPAQGRVLVSAHGQGDRVVYSVQDAGAGIPADCVNRVFEKFYRVPGHDKDTQGVGLGLAIAREVVQAHGGKITCQSHEGVGTTFQFWLATTPDLSRNAPPGEKHEQSKG